MRTKTKVPPHLESGSKIPSGGGGGKDGLVILKTYYFKGFPKSPLYHISFNGKLAGRWTPRNPDGFIAADKLPKVSKSQLDRQEPDLPRISLSPSLSGCFYAVYPNISNLFEVKRYPYLDFFVYRAVPNDTARILHPVDLTKLRLVWDAHVTREYVSLDPIDMELVMKIRIYDPTENDGIYTHPFNDANMSEVYVAPSNPVIRKTLIYPEY